MHFVHEFCNGNASVKFNLNKESVQFSLINVETGRLQLECTFSFLRLWKM
jgi:hypothetical protein